MSIPNILSGIIITGIVILLITVLRHKPRNQTSKILTGSVCITLVLAISAHLAFNETPPQIVILSSSISLISIFSLITTYYFFLCSIQNKSAHIGITIGYLTAFILLPLIITEKLSINATIIYGVPLINNKFIYPIASIYIGLLSKELIPFIKEHHKSRNFHTNNNSTYILLGIITALSLTLIQLLPPLRTYPLSQLGNLICLLCFMGTLIKDELLDLRVVARRGLAYVSLALMLHIAIYLVFNIIHNKYTIEVNPLPFIIGAAIALLFVSVFYYFGNSALTLVEKIILKETYTQRQMMQNYAMEMRPLLDLEEVAGQTLNMILIGLRAKKVCLLLEDKGGNFTTSFLKDLDGNNDIHLKLKKNSPAISWLEKNDQPLNLYQLNNIPQLSMLSDQDKEALRDSGLEFLCAMKNGDRIISILGISKKRKGRYTPEDLQLLYNVLKNAGVIVENAVLYQAILQRAKESALLTHLGNILTSSLDINISFSAFIVELKKLVPIEFSSICTVEKDQQLRFIALYSETGLSLSTGEIISIQGTPLQSIIKNKEFISEPDLKVKKEFDSDADIYHAGMRSVVHLPLFSEGDVVGNFTIACREPDIYSQKELTFLEQLSAQMSLAVQNSELYRQTRQIAITDSVTELRNHRCFHEDLDTEVARSLRSNRTFSLVFLDLDSFKLFNDTYGHLAGDNALKEVGISIKKSIRDMDKSFRYGGDEFAIILPETDYHGAFTVAERVRKSIEDKGKEKNIPLTISVGIASWPKNSVTKDDLIKAADAALYKAKRSGTNQTCLYSEEEVIPLLQTSTPTIIPRSSIDVMYTLVAATEAKIPHAPGHSKRVCEYSIALAKEIGLPQEKISIVEAAALLHDIGKLGVPSRILRKKETLDEKEWEALRAHPSIGVDILRQSNDFDDILPLILFHHEHYDGSGYPSGLFGKQIPLEARILGIADAYEAMTSLRPYRDALSPAEALQEMKFQSRKQFDPELVKVFCNLCEKMSIRTVPSNWPPPIET